MMIVPAVFLRIVEMERRGGPTDEDLQRASETADMLGEQGDVLIHGGGKPGQCADLFNRTAHAIAVLAFAPGGVELFGTRFEAKVGERRKVRKANPRAGEPSMPPSGIAAQRDDSPDPD